MARPILRSRSLSRRAVLATGAASAAAVALASPAAASTTPGGSAPADGSGFASAEDAVAGYLAALAAADFDGAVATFAIEPYVEHFDLEALLDHLRFYLPGNTPQLLTNNDPFNTAINLAQRRATASREVTNQYFALVDPAFERTPNGIRLEDEAAVDTFVDEMETTMVSAPLADLADYELVAPADLDPEAAEFATDDRVAELNDRQLAFTGADESAELAVRSSIGERSVGLLFRAVRYGDSWWIETLQGTLAILLGLDAIAPGVLWLDGGGATSDAPAGSTPPGTEQ